MKYKLGNFAAINDPGTGFENYSAADKALFEEWVSKSDDLRATADAIRAAIVAGVTPPPDVLDDSTGMTEAPEGALLTGSHVRRERNAKLVKTKKTRAMGTEGKLTCEGCGFDFAVIYGERGEGFIECHHTKPVHTLQPGQRTKLEDPRARVLELPPHDPSTGALAHDGRASRAGSRTV